LIFYLEVDSFINGAYAVCVRDVTACDLELSFSSDTTVRMMAHIWFPICQQVWKETNHKRATKRRI